VKDQCFCHAKVFFPSEMIGGRAYGCRACCLTFGCAILFSFIPLGVPSDPILEPGPVDVWTTSGKHSLRIIINNIIIYY
jgi:hypothetical protein